MFHKKNATYVFLQFFQRIVLKCVKRQISTSSRNFYLVFKHRSESVIKMYCNEHCAVPLRDWLTCAHPAPRFEGQLIALGSFCSDSEVEVGDHGS